MFTIKRNPCSRSTGTRTLRPSIDAKVFAFVEAHEFARRDFPQSGYNVHRLSRDVLLHKASWPAREIEAMAEWMLKTIMRCAGASQAKNDAVGRRRGRPARKRAFQLSLGGD